MRRGIVENHSSDWLDRMNGSTGPEPLCSARTAIETIESVERLAELAAEWAALWLRVDGATVFQHPAWLLPWCRHLATGPLRVVAARRGGRLVALLPFAATSSGLTLAGSGVSDYTDALVEPGSEELVAPLLARVVDGFPSCAARDLPAGSVLARASLPGSAPAERDSACPLLPLPTERPLELAPPPGFARRLAYARRRAEREGCRFADVAPDNLTELLDALFQLHAARWRPRGEEGVLAEPRIERFHREAAPALLAAGMLSLHGLRNAAGSLIAVSYGFVARGTASLYLSGFDPAYAARSPGALAIGRSLEVAHAAGARAFDFLRGGERYKYEWGAHDRFTLRRVLRAPTEAR